MFSTVFVIRSLLCPQGRCFLWRAWGSPGIVAGMARLSRFVTVVALLGGATVFLSACTGGTDPAASPSPSVTTVVTSSPSASPSPTPLTDEELLALIPESARAENFGSAGNFAKFFINLYPRLFQPGPQPEIALFERLSAPSCGFCETALVDAAATQDADAYNTGGEFTWPDDSVRGELQSDGYWHLTRAFQVNDRVTYLADGTVHSTEEGGTGQVGLTLEYVEGAWSVLGVKIIDD